MPRKLKTFQTSLGFYDLAIAAQSMKAALEAWGAGSNLFHQGFAKETNDADVVAATMSRPGVVLRRPAGSNGRFREDADLPTDLGCDEVGVRRERTRSKANKRRPPKISESAARKAAALEFERKQKRREAERLREEASSGGNASVGRRRSRRLKAREKHEAKASAIEAERAEVEKRAEDEKARWEKQEKLQTALREARE
jgi:colicin import membrane protein